MELPKYLVFFLLLHTVVSDFSFVHRSNTTTLHPPLERMLSRKKRVLLMPKGGNLKFTTSLSKRLISAVPRGFNFVIEAALYYPTPGQRIDLIPIRLRKPTTTTPKPIGTKPPIFVCIPGSLICYRAKPAMKPMKVQRIDENITDVQWIDSKNYNEQDHWNYPNFQQQYATNPHKWAQWTKYGQPQQYHKYNWSPTEKEQQKYYQKWPPRPQTTWTKWTTRTPQHQTQQNSWWNSNTTDYNKWMRPRLQQYQTQVRQQRWRRTLTLTHRYLPIHKTEQQTDDDPHDNLHKYEPIYFPDLEPFYDWQHYHAHRDRRQLFYQFEGLSHLLGIDMKSCIVRAICEGKRYLLPPGYSMIHDILRLVFTLPTIDGLTDDYSRAMNADYETCDKFLRPKCAFNILDWFINSKTHFQ